MVDAVATRSTRRIHTLAVAVFGILVPLALLAEAFMGLWTLSGALSKEDQVRSPITSMKAISGDLKSVNDYILFSQLVAETTNKAVVTNKQVMKASVMQIGFALASVGLMFVILGISDGGATTSVGKGDVKLDFKTSSTGAVVFVIGAAMATAGGVMKNDYATVPMPSFAAFVTGEARPPGDRDAQRQHAMSIAAYKHCAEAGDALATCFATDFAAINGESLK